MPDAVCVCGRAFGSRDAMKAHAAGCEAAGAGAGMPEWERIERGLVRLEGERRAVRAAAFAKVVGK